jgi:hypothetical protein
VELTGIEEVGQSATNPEKHTIFATGSDLSRSGNVPVRDRWSALASIGESESEIVSDAALERAIVDAVAMGLGDVARTLATRLEERRRALVPANVADLATELAEQTPK